MLQIIQKITAFISRRKILKNVFSLVIYAIFWIKTKINQIGTTATSAGLTDSCLYVQLTRVN